MTRRMRIRLLVILVVVGIPLLLVAIIGWYVASGRLDRRIERAYAEHFPGRLEVGDVRVASASKLVLIDVRLFAADGATAIVTVRVLTVGGSPLTMHLNSVNAEGIAIAIDRSAVDLVKQFAKQPRGEGATKIPDLDVHATASIAIGSGTRIDDLRFDLTAKNGRLSGGLSGKIDEDPLQIGISSADDGGFHHLIALKALKLSTHRLLESLGEVGAMDPIPKIVPWIPDLAEMHDAQLRFDPSARQLSGALPLSWTTGTGSATIALNADGLRIDPAQVDDSELGSASGKLAVDFRQKALSVEVPSWQPGPRLPIPKKLNLSETLRLLPSARFELTTNTGKPRFHLTALPDLSGADYQSSLDLIGEKHGPLHVRANDVPLTLAQPWLPDDVTVDGGRVLAMLLEADDGKVQSLALTAAEARFTVSHWQLGPIDAGIEIAPLSDAEGLATTAILPMGTLEYRGTGDSGVVIADVVSLKRLVEQVHGPTQAPALSGKVRLESTVARAEVLRGQIKELKTTNVKLAEVFRALDATSSGSYEYVAAEKTFAIHLSGQVHRGDVWIPSTWLDIAARQPVFTATVGVSPGKIDVQEILARAADDQGQPAAEGFTAEMNGALTAEPVAGTIKGVIDRADLDWVKSNTKLVPLPKSAAIKGRGAATFTAALNNNGVEQVDGYFLPLNDDLSILKDDRNAMLDISGIKGAVKFRLAKAK